MYEKIAAKITEVWRKNGKLPYTHNRHSYEDVACMYKNEKKTQFACFYYTNSWMDLSQGDYGEIFGPSIRLDEAIRNVWNDLDDGEQTEIMASILGSKCG